MGLYICPKHVLMVTIGLKKLYNSSHLKIAKYEIIEF
jgi:hypothetical protein